jgi:hypothetical protein
MPPRRRIWLERNRPICVGLQAREAYDCVSDWCNGANDVLDDDCCGMRIGDERD